MLSFSSTSSLNFSREKKYLLYIIWCFFNFSIFQWNGKLKSISFLMSFVEETLPFLTRLISKSHKKCKYRTRHLICLYCIFRHISPKNIFDKIEDLHAHIHMFLIIAFWIVRVRSIQYTLTNLKHNLKVFKWGLLVYLLWIRHIFNVDFLYQTWIYYSYQGNGTHQEGNSLWKG